MVQLKFLQRMQMTTILSSRLLHPGTNQLLSHVGATNLPYVWLKTFCCLKAKNEVDGNPLGDSVLQYTQKHFTLKSHHIKRDPTARVGAALNTRPLFRQWHTANYQNAQERVNNRAVSRGNHHNGPTLYIL